MHDKAFNFQTLNPDTIIDGLFDLGMRVDSGLTPLNSYENRSLPVSGRRPPSPCGEVSIVLNVGLPNRSRGTPGLPFSSRRDDVPVAAPLFFNDSTLHSASGLLFCRVPQLRWALDLRIIPDQMEWVGRYLCRMHQTGRAKRCRSSEIGTNRYLFYFQVFELLPADFCWPERCFLSATDKLIDGSGAMARTRANFTVTRVIAMQETSSSGAMALVC